MSLRDNPFTKLFNSLEDAERFVNQRASQLNEKSGSSLDPKPEEANEPSKAANNFSSHEDFDNFYILENIFLLTAESGKGDKLYLLELQNINKEDVRDDNLSFLVYERLMASEEIKGILKRKPKLESSPSFETDPMKYLAECYSRLCDLFGKPFLEQSNSSPTSSSDLPSKCFSLIRDQALLLFELPDLLTDFSPIDHLSQLLQSSYISTPDTELQLQFYAHLVEHLSGGGADANRLSELFHPILEGLLREVKGYNDFQGSMEVQLFRFPSALLFFSRNSYLASVLLRYDKHLIQKTSLPEKSLLGSLLSLGSNPKFFSLLSDYLDDPRSLTQNNISNLEANVHRFLEDIQSGMYELFKRLLRIGAEVKEELLLWIGDALHSYRDRNKLWNVQMSLVVPTVTSDNFLLNLQSVLLRSFDPVVSNPDSSKLLLIQPSYPHATMGDRSSALSRNIHMREIPGTRLIPSISDAPSPSSDEAPSASATTEVASPLPSSSSLEDKYTLTSEMFFMIHSCFNVGFSVVHDKFTKLNQEMNQIRERYQETLDQGLGSSEAGLRLKEQLQIALPVYYSCKAALMQPHLIEKSFKFSVLTANFLVHVAMATKDDPSPPKEIKRARFPPPLDTTKTGLRFIPEYVIQNFHSCLLLLRRTEDKFFEEHHEYLGSLLDFIVTFMSGAQFIHNPHIRAEMAETLECLFPRAENEQNQASQSTLISGNFYRERLLSEHPNARHLTTSIMRLFVGMELTGHGVQFENKFRYRQPMYIMFKHLWKMDIHKMALVDLARYAEEHLNDVDAPLFLRFINLLINDAIYLLDEALSLMTQIKEKTQQHDPDWSDLPANQRQEMEATFRQLSLLARFHNIMGVETITTLANLTSIIHSIFTHPVMVDRLAAMLNYFLLHLVGPKKRNLKVPKPEEYKFEPRSIVKEICRTYENLSEDENFLRAVSRDGRSYSHDLFRQASDVLCRIKEPFGRIEKFNRLAERIEELAREEAEEDEVMADIPEDFLDPIMGTLMRDPVLLPSSGKVVDRQTIARHILSDQSDPFNRQPLTMNMIKPADELKAKIEEWIAENKRGKR